MEPQPGRLLGGVGLYIRVPAPAREAVKEAWPVLHSFEPGLDQRGELAEVVLGEVGQGLLEV